MHKVKGCPACHSRASMTAERIVPSPAFKEISPSTHGYSSAAVATGNLTRSCLSKSILLGRPSQTAAGGKGREQEWQELIYLSQASVSLSTTHSSSITAGSYGENGLCGSESALVTAGRIPQTELGCKKRHREDGWSQQRCFDLCSWSEVK